jgi:hypothetical protein
MQQHTPQLRKSDDDPNMQGIMSTRDLAKHRDAIPTGAQLVLSRARAAEKRQELQEKREAGEISQHNVALDVLEELAHYNMPLRRKDMKDETGYRPVVLSRSDMDHLCVFSFIHASGDQMDIEAESLPEGDVFILYPDEVGE